MKRQAPLVLILLAVAIGGCGSGSSTTPGGLTPVDDTADNERSPTKAEFIAEADSHCEASKAKQEPLRAKIEQLTQRARTEEGGTGTISDSTRKELAQTLEQIVTISDTGLSRLQALGVPKADAS